MQIFGDAGRLLRLLIHDLNPKILIFFIIIRIWNRSSEFTELKVQSPPSEIPKGTRLPGSLLGAVGGVHFDFFLKKNGLASPTSRGLFALFRERAHKRSWIWDRISNRERSTLDSREEDAALLS